VFGERETGASYSRQGYQRQDYTGPRYGAGGYSGYGDRPGRSGYGGADIYQERQSLRGGRYYGDDGRSRIYRDEYGEPDYSAQGYDRSHPDHWEFGFGYDLEGRDYGLGAPRRTYERDYGRGEGMWDRTRRFFGRDREYERQEGHRGRGPQGYKRSDERIADDVHDRLTEDPYLDATQVSVTVRDGEVTLAGAVTSRHAKHHAEHIVEDLSGVKHVQNNLRVEERPEPRGATTNASSPLGENTKLNEQAAGKA
jgi:hypothetical protein